MIELLCFLILAVIIARMFMPSNKDTINEIRRDLSQLQRRVTRLEDSTNKNETLLASEVSPDITKPVIPIMPPIIEPVHEKVYDDPWKSANWEHKAEAQTSSRKTEKQSSASFEQQFGSKAFVWMGGIALALAGFFMVKYSIETGLLSPAVRVVIGLVFGVGMLGGGNWVRTKPNLANGTRIAQALSGAGIADLYACLFAATSIYDLVHPTIGFSGMAAVTAVAIVLSLRHGMPIALLGLIGGFITPAMVGQNNPNAPLLFLYLYVVLAGLIVVIRRQGWWKLSLAAVIAAFAWVLIWLFGGNFSPSDSICLSLFIIAVSSTVIIASKKQYAADYNQTDIFKPSSALNFITVNGAVMLMGIITGHSDFGFMEWGLFGLLSVGSIVLAFFNQKLYGFAPWVAMAVTVIMLKTWHYSNPQDFALILSLFAILYVVSAYIFQTRSKNPTIWAGMVGATSLVYYLLGYFALYETRIVDGIPLFWGYLALALTALSVYALQKIMREMPENNSEKQNMLAIYAGIATAFLSIGMTIELDHQFLSIAFAGEVLALSWINTKVSIYALRYITAALACVFVFLLLPQFFIVTQITAYSLVNTKMRMLETAYIVSSPALHLGIPALCFAISSYFLRLKKDGKLVRIFEISAIALGCIMSYFLIRHAFHADEYLLLTEVSFTERGVITNILFAYGLVCLWGGKKYGRNAVILSGLVLSCIAAFRVCYFDYIVNNPLWSSQEVGKLFIINSLLITYGLPILWLSIARIKLLELRSAKTWHDSEESIIFSFFSFAKYCYAFILVLAFTLVSFNVRQFFHGTLLNGHINNSAEIYTYSAVWLVFGVGVLLLGTLRQDKAIRAASLAIMLFTIGKVFLYDASELTGLWRVFSFAGLGLSLLCLSWFYSRFVFVNKQELEK